MKVIPFDKGKAVAHGMDAPYGRVVAVLVLDKLSDASLRGLYDLAK
jgi:hypothetical protein